MKIAIHLRGQTIGGYETQLWELTKLLRRQGDSIDIICPDGSVAKYFSALGAVIPPPSPTLNGWGALLKELKPQLVLTVQGEIGALGASARRLKIPVLWVCGYPVEKKAERVLLKDTVPLLFDRVLVPSYFMKREVDEALGIASSVLNVGIDTDMFCPGPKNEREDIRQKLGLTQDTLLIGYAARFARHKRHIDLAQLLLAARKQNFFPHLLLMGWSQGDEYKSPFNELWGFVRKHQLTRQVHLLSAYSEALPSLYRAMDVFVSPAENEGLGCSLLEAMATELPVLVAKSGGAVEPLQHGACGYSFEKGKIDELLEHLQSLRVAPALRRHLGTAGREIVSQHYSHESIYRSFSDIRSEVMAHKSQ